MIPPIAIPSLAAEVRRSNGGFFFKFCRDVGVLIDVVDIYQEYNRGTYRDMQFQGFGFYFKVFWRVWDETDIILAS